MTFNRRTPLLGAALAFAAGLLLSSGASAATVIRFAHAGPESDTQHAAALEFKRIVEERSNGAIQVRIFPNNVLGNDQAMIAGVRAGQIDIEMSGSGNFTGLVPEMGVIDIPFMFSGPAHAHRVMDGDVGRYLLDKLDDRQLKGLAFWEVGFRSITNSRGPVRTPDDVRGLKIRTTPNPSHIAAFRLLGANPVPMALAELYTALEMGAVDAQEHPIGITWSAKLYEVQQYLTLSRHAYTPLVVVMNKARFESLSAEHREIILEAARAGSAHHRTLNAEGEAAIIAAMREAGLDIIEEFDPAPFRALVKDETIAIYIRSVADGISLVERIDALR